MLNEKLLKMSLSSDAASSEAETARRRSVSPSFLRALGLMKVTADRTTISSDPLSKSRGADTDKYAGGARTSVHKESKRCHKKRSEFKSGAASTTAKKTSRGKKEHVSKRKDRAKKRSSATSFDESENIPLLVIKKTRKPAAPATDKPTTKKEAQNVEEQQHEASPPARNVSASPLVSEVNTAENLADLTSDPDEDRFWGDILQSDFKSSEYTNLLKEYFFTDEQTVAIQKSFQYMCRSLCRRPTKRERFMKTHECIECNFSISHQCLSLDSTEYWTFGGHAPCIEFIAPESTTMCLCNFTVLHSHSKKPKSKAEMKLLEQSGPPPTSHWVENNRAVNMECPKCFMNVFMSNRNNDVCTDLINFTSTDGPNRKKFFNWVHNHLNYSSKDAPTLTDFYCCSNFCCLIFHRCEPDVIVHSSEPIQLHRPMLSCFPNRQM